MKTLTAMLAISMIIFSSSTFAGTENPVNKSVNAWDTQLQKTDSNMQVIMDQLQLETESIQPHTQPSLSGLVEKKMTDLQTVDRRQKEPDKTESSR